ncbi:uncharacterized protein LAJ45_00493 [Morchella importuna]|uniref:uncharacterized protein n=1 Tax=Morchella importuna TaxID=1174673 RepID=UPI001E8ED5B8|nr:uncharacterized protein LAJ45_00493 [Morchella importuna]KAH8155483.1 hypothetical protein LAJ45_00493 [Morchella importuna]
MQERHENAVSEFSNRCEEPKAERDIYNLRSINSIQSRHGQSTRPRYKYKQVSPVDFRVLRGTCPRHDVTTPTTRTGSLTVFESAAAS